MEKGDFTNMTKILNLDMMHFPWIIWRILIYPNEPLTMVEEIVRQEVEQDKKGEIQYSRRTHAVHEGRGKWPSAKKMPAGSFCGLQKALSS